MVPSFDKQCHKQEKHMLPFLLLVWAAFLAVSCACSATYFGRKGAARTLVILVMACERPLMPSRKPGRGNVNFSVAADSS